MMITKVCVLLKRLALGEDEWFELLEEAMFAGFDQSLCILRR